VMIYLVISITHHLGRKINQPMTRHYKIRLFIDNKRD